MRKETWFRGPLLSVLFFALLIGGAPVSAAASSEKPQSTSQNLVIGGWMITGACSFFGAGHNITNFGTALMTVVGILSGNGGVAAVGAGGWAYNRMIDSACAEMGLGRHANDGDDDDGDD